MIVGIVAYDLRPSIFFALMPVVLVVFGFSLLVGHFLAQPLVELHRKIEAFKKGDSAVDFSARGNLYEADMLSEDFCDLCGHSKSWRSSLLTKQRRQAKFISDVAHELRTPLTAIRGNAEILEDPDLPPELHQKFCTTIINEAERLTRLSNDLLTLQHIEEDTTPLELSRVNLKDIVQDAVDALASTLQERNANVAITGEAPDVLGNVDRLKQVVINLVENASRFVDAGGHIQIDLYGLNGRSLMAVKDDGPGFGDIDPQLLFDRFYRADSSRTRGTGGTGLGLAIVKSTVEAHDGTVLAFNRPEGGACFLVALPALSPLET